MYIIVYFFASTVFMCDFFPFDETDLSICVGIVCACTLCVYTHSLLFFPFCSIAQYDSQFYDDKNKESGLPFLLFGSFDEDYRITANGGCALTHIQGYIYILHR